MRRLRIGRGYEKRLLPGKDERDGSRNARSLWGLTQRREEREPIRVGGYTVLTTKTYEWLKWKILDHWRVFRFTLPSLEQ